MDIKNVQEAEIRTLFHLCKEASGTISPFFLKNQSIQGLSS